MRLRIYHWYMLGTLAFFIVAIVFSEIKPTSLYKPDAWAGISIAIGATILTLVGIVTSILTSRENDRRAEFSDNLSELLTKLETKTKTNPDKSLVNVYENSQEKMILLLEIMKPLKYVDGIWGILSFISFVGSALFALWGYPFKWTLLFFLMGISFLGGYIIYYMEECWRIDKMATIPKKKGKLTLLSLKINGESYHFKEKGNEAFFSLSEQLNRIELKARFEGEVRNGFLDAFVKYNDELYSWIPDSNTFLSDFGFTDDYRLTLLEGTKFDTGVLQTSDKPLELSFDIVLRSKKKILLARGIVDGQIKEVYRHCSIPEGFVVDYIDVRLYEDPSFKPKYKRRIVDYVTLRPQRDIQSKKRS